MNKDFVKYEQAIKLKKLGFDEPCIAFYDAYNGNSHLCFKLRFNYHWLLRVIMAIKNKEYQQVIETSQGHLEYLEGDNAVLAPTYSQIFRWFRNKYKFFASPTEYDDNKILKYDWLVTKNLDNGKYLIRQIGYKNTYEEAESACIDLLIDLVNQDKNI